MIDDEGNNLGEMSKYDALDLARSKQLDLFVISEKSEVPIAKILDYGKHKFEQSKKEKGQKKKQGGNDFKEIKMRINIDIGDYNTRLNHSKKFLEKGKRVKLNITLRGREMQHKDLAKDLARRFINDLACDGHPDGPIDKLTGRSLVAYVIPGADKAKVKKMEQDKKDAENSTEE